MFTNVVVGVDNRDGGRDAIALAKRLLSGAGELTLAHVYVGEPYAYRGVGAQYKAAERQGHLDQLARARAEAGLRARLGWREASSPGRGLQALCEEIDADLLVVGSSRRGALRRVLLGDDAREALDGAPCAVAIASTGFSREPADLSRIGVGYDGSAICRDALEVARALTAEHGSKLLVFETVQTPDHRLHPHLPGERAPDGSGLDAARDRIATLGEVKAYAASGKPGEELARYSATVDLLVIGSHRSAAIGVLQHESTAQRLARTARCPLLVLAPAARRPDSSDPGVVSEPRSR